MAHTDKRKYNPGKMGDMKKYENDPYPFPDPYIDPKIKGKKEYIRANAEAMWSEYVRNQYITKYYLKETEPNDFGELRGFADGNQDVETYRQKFFAHVTSQASKNPDDTDLARLGEHTISWDIMSECPNYVDAIVGALSQIKNKISVTAIDENSTDQRAEKKLQALEIQNDPFYQQMAARLGMAPPKNIPTGGEKEIDIKLKSDANYALEHEMALQAILNYCMTELSHFEEEVQEDLIRDAVTLGWIIARDVVDGFDHKSRAVYVDPGMALIPSSPSRHYRDIEKAGHIEWMALSEVIRQAKGMGKGGLTEDEIKKIISTAQERSQNSGVTSRGYSNITEKGRENWFGGTEYDNLRVPVLVGEYKTWNIEKQERRDRKGNVPFNKVVPFDYKEQKKSKSKVKTIERECWYEYRWIIGTEYMISWGRRNWDINNRGKTYSSYSCFRVAKKSLVAQMIPCLNAKQIAWLRFQEAWVKMIPAGFNVDWNQISNIKTDSGGKLSWYDLISLKVKTGIGINLEPTNSKNPRAGRRSTNWEPTSSPIMEIIQAYQLTDQMLTDKLTKITGIAPDMLGQGAQPNQLVGVTEMIIAGTQNKLRPMLQGLLHVKERAAGNMALRIQMVARHSDLPFYPEVSEFKQQILKIGKDLGKYRFGTKIEIEGSEKTKQDILAVAAKSVEKGQLKDSDYLFITRKLENGEYQYAQQYLEVKQAEYAEQAEQQQMALIEKNAETNNMAAQTQLQGTTQIEQMKGEIKAMLIDKQAEADKVVDGALAQIKAMLQESLDDNKARNDLLLQDDQQAHEKSMPQKAEA